jgi:hypothetical protein
MHTYATLDDAKQYLTDEGIAWADGSTNDALALGILESVSRRVDEWCRRSRFGSGFGPRIGTNRYDASGGTTLDFTDDLLTTTSVVSRAVTASSTTTAPAADTDFYLVNQQGTYEPGPYRRAILHGQGTVTAFGSGRRVVEWAGTWGHQDVTRTLTPTTAEELDATETVVDVSALGELSPGMTILIGSEQMYVRAVTDATPDTITVDRGVNGTEAATHTTAAPILRYVYDPAVVEVTLRVWAKRWRSRDAGGDGSDGGGQVGVTVPRESEDTILRRGVGHLRLLGAVVF